jgi:TonB family protein
MIAAWIAYCLVVGLLLAGAALAFEHAFRLYGRPVRWVWLGAMIGSLALPLSTYVLPGWQRFSRESLPPALQAAVEGLTVAAGPLSAGPTTRPLLAQIDSVLIALWLLASLTLLLFYLRSYRCLRSESRDWSAEVLAGSTVFISRQLGPAVLGLVRGRIVIPRWALELEEGLRRLVLTHEEEHVRAGDHRLLGFALAALVLMPWNLPLWWQFRRLRLAVELDCDGRVLLKGAQPQLYGTLLLEVARHGSGLATLPTAFAEHKTFLERRVRNMTARRPHRRVESAIAASLIAGTLLAAACQLRAPQESTESGVDLPPAESVAQEIGAEPVFTPYTARPEFKDLEEAKRAVERHYPEDLKGAGIGGTMVVWVFIDSDGNVANVKLKESSGNEALDAAGLVVAREWEFIPARNREEVVPVWMAIPITFAVKPKS